MDWSCEYSIKGLSSSVKRCFQERANFLHFDMGTRKYKGVLVDLPDTKFHSGQKGRSTESRNPVWYSEFYWRNTPHTEIKYSNKIKRSNNNGILGLITTFYLLIFYFFFFFRCINNSTSEFTLDMILYSKNEMT